MEDTNTKTLNYETGPVASPLLFCSRRVPQEATHKGQQQPNSNYGLLC